jgi:divalent metal cation (Fe/Co/Zn/Cd) transporter
MSRDQTIRLCWCLCHILISGIVLYSSGGSLALTALSHLIFFDAISATICVAVDIFHNFEVWKRSSIRHPFGLERAEVLGGFAMSIFLLFMGFDLISHNLKHVLESLGSHTPHHPHSHQRVSPGSVDFAALLSIIATLISAIGLKNHARIGKAMRFAYLTHLPSVLSNPSHFLTLSCSTIMLLLPLLTITMYLWLDRLLCAIIAMSMFMLGVRLAMAQGLMLLMSYSGKGVGEVMREIANEPAVTGIEEARFWQVHYGLCMANLKLRVKGSGMGPSEEQAIAKLRERISLLIRNRLGGGYGKGAGLKWEVTVQAAADMR